ncbi:hypothetical protein MUN89_19670 [Halobacillus salinarum]|uniref:SHOCT domain-containing protein n=1 Tax=Halobacillus salinarum TaxID=2932257 RepID=A0ABY4EIY7_9BACI|nr:hypothetical protein [Halobacillus salinarum]UOQ44056.1 hypothetical protein MUN89_19670 [Halobacillus salinarum]
MCHWGVFPPFIFFFFIVFTGMFVVNIVMWRRRRWGWYNGSRQRGGQAILERRLAKGEIDVDDYKRLKQVLDED